MPNALNLKIHRRCKVGLSGMRLGSRTILSPWAIQEGQCMGSIQKDIVCDVFRLLHELGKLGLEGVCVLPKAMQAENAQLL